MPTGIQAAVKMDAGAPENLLSETLRTEAVWQSAKKEVEKSKAEGIGGSAMDYIRRKLKYALPTNWRAAAMAIYRRLFESGLLFSTETDDTSAIQAAEVKE